MANDLFDSAQRILTERLVWETKMRRYAQMRRGGLPRRDKTKAWQADGWSQTIDRAIRKSKPFWLGQVSAGDRLCNFTALMQQVQEMSDAAADFYDYTTHTKTKLMTEIDRAVDFMLLKGRGVIKSVVDPMDEYRIVDEAVDPMFLLMPESSDNFEDADEWIHVRLMTVAAYRQLDQRWDTSPDTIKKIRGTKDFQSLGIYTQEMQLREGITHTSNSNYVMIFEHWVKTAGGHTINYYSPNDPDLPLRKPHGNPYKYNGKESIPFHSFQMEVIDKGWYAPRGLGEMLEVQEMTETFIENKWSDAMTMANTRIFTGAKEIQNMANLRMEDGQYIPGEISSVQFAPPSMPWDEMLNYQRGRSEEISQTPDSSSVATGSKTGGKAITATEAQSIASLNQVGMNYMAEIFRRDLIPLHQHRWGMLCQFKPKEMAYFITQELKTLPEQAMHDKYMIVPDGSPDGWNPQVKMQRDIGFMQTFASLQNSNPDYWVERAMQSCVGGQARQGFKGTGMKAADEAEAQASEIQLLIATPPFPVKVQPQQDQLTRIQTILQWLQAAHGLGVPVNPQGKALVMQNLAQRMQILQQQNPAAHKQVAQLVQQMEQMSQQMPAGHLNGASPQNAPQSPQNGAGQPASNGTGGNGSPQSKPISEIVSFNYKDLQPDVQAQALTLIGLRPSAMPPVNPNPQLEPQIT